MQRDRVTGECGLITLVTLMAGYYFNWFKNKRTNLCVSNAFLNLSVFIAVIISLLVKQISSINLRPIDLGQYFEKS